MHTKSQGILLHTIPYLGKRRILKVFTEESGLITLMEKNTFGSALSPFCIAEWIYLRKTSEIFTLTESSLFDSLHDLRQSYSALATAGAMAQDILQTQLPGKNAQNLYNLLSSYFKKIGAFERPSLLAASFRLKLLLHEGLLALQTQCVHCGKEANLLIEGESVCPDHRSPRAIGFSSAEWQILQCLAFAKQFSLLQQIDYPASLDAKIASLFEERIEH